MAEDNTSTEERANYLVPINKLPADRRSRLLEKSELLALKRKQTIFEQGDRDDFTFYVLSGEIELYADDSLIKRVEGGEGASFQPLAQLQPRQMTAIVKSRKAEVLRVNRSMLDQLLSMGDAPEPVESGVEVEEMESEQSGDWLMTLLQSDLFTRVPPSNIQGLLDTLETVSFSAGDDVVNQGEPGDYYYAIQSGSCEVVRKGSNNREIKLAELKAGDTFGEEALISGAKRNATVRMVSNGDLARLTKDDFTTLIKAPLLNNIDLKSAEEKVDAGARWLDVRFEDEHSFNGLENSINIPLGTLRTRTDELDDAASYVAYCDSGGRSSAAAFLLAERGFDVAYVEGGAVAEKIPEKPEVTPAKTAAAPDKADAVEAAALASAIDEELEKARHTVEQAQQMMAQAEAMKQEAEKFVAEKLAVERERLKAEQKAFEETMSTTESLKIELEKQMAEVEKSMAAREHEVDERAKQVENELKQRLEEKLSEAETLKASLGKQKAAADKAAQEHEKEIEERLQTLEAESKERLADEEKRLGEFYQKQTEQLENLQADKEAALREQLAQELASERSKFEQEFLKTEQALEKAREERQLAVQAKEAAAEEAKTAIERFKAEQQKLLDEQRQELEQERKRLKEEAERIEKLRSEAVKAREIAEAEKKKAEQELAMAKAQNELGSAEEQVDVTIIEEIEQRASNAQRDLDNAVKTETAVVDAARENEDELERTYDTANEINILLERELTDWVDEQDKVQESTLQREILSRQKEIVDRIKQRAKEAKKNAESRNRSLLDEIQEQLGDD